MENVLVLLENVNHDKNILIICFKKKKEVYIYEDKKLIGFGKEDSRESYFR